jgi:hypothetical protein
MHNIREKPDTTTPQLDLLGEPMQVVGNEIHLVIDDALLEGRAISSAAPRVLKTVRVAGDVSYLHSGASAESLVTSTGSTGALMIEPLPAGPRPRLLLLTPNGALAPAINGHRATRVCLLRVGDQLLLDDGRLLHVTAYSTPRIGPPTEQQIGAHCPVCRTPVTRKHVRVFTCPCGSVAHYDDPADTANDNCLECATIPRECLVCHLEICLSGGFQYVPDFA